MTRFQKIYEHHASKINFTGVRSRPVLVVFSAIPGSGKSELTKRLVQDYGFLRIANKDIREAISKSNLPDGPAVIGPYTLWLLDKLAQASQPSIVFDRNIDQWYASSKAWAEAHCYDYVLIRIDASRKLLEQRLMKREGDPDAKAFQVLDFYAEQHRKIGNSMSPRIHLRDNYDLDVVAGEIADC